MADQTATQPADVTYDATNGQPVTPVLMTPAMANMPSIIKINPQIATTLVWVGVGVAIGLWLSHKMKSPRSN